jgi:hypothetical protein
MITKDIADIEKELAEKATELLPTTSYEDTKATWHYWSDMDTMEQGVSDEWVWERLRLRRDALLSATDFRMVTDAPWPLEPWTVYRQALRNLPKSTKDPRLSEWPEAPE